MTYQYATERADYADLASGKVFYNHPHQPAFPVRLTSEVFQRCMAIRARHGQSTPATVYDPCCGSGYLLSTLGYLHAENISRLVASDISADVLRTAELNLSLLTSSGLAHRRQSIEHLLAQYDKDSHRDALAAIDRMQSRIDSLHLPTTAFQADATDPASLTEYLSPATIDIVIADVPYGQHSAWQGAHSRDPIPHLLIALQTFLSPSVVVALCTDKSQKVGHPRFRRADQFQIGKRRITLLMNL